jgi:hypothetical protein
LALKSPAAIADGSVYFFNLRIVRTGRNEEGSAKGTALVRSSYSARHESSWFDFFPSGDRFCLGRKREMRAIDSRQINFRSWFVHRGLSL